ncbi:MAG: helix-turn-helix domain-containing protein [Oscillospiraceae bacterium]|nr:helix-turn-helix domain-containing protein [Oscillospiraceae bacterium]
MRRHRPLIGWPMRNSKWRRFSMPNEIWNQKLRPIEFTIFSYLCYYQSHNPPDQITLQMIANGVHSTKNTVKKYIESLINKGLITGEQTLTANLQCNSCKNFFTLPNEIFLLKLPPSAFMVYAYLLLIEDRKTNTCHPSYNTIAAGTGLSQNTALKSIDILLEAGLITVEPSNYFDRRRMKWKGNNLYTILPIYSAMDIFHQRQLRQLEIDVAQSRLAAQSAV